MRQQDLTVRLDLRCAWQDRHLGVTIWGPPSGGHHLGVAIWGTAIWGPRHLGDRHLGDRHMELVGDF